MRTLNRLWETIYIYLDYLQIAALYIPISHRKTVIIETGGNKDVRILIRYRS